ncbi:PH domain-containing protein [Nocardia sp. alder85J]|uniref:PH domain-containing protein n=1 Tax=Nocardia sp. alder85J TaxID=2862949 RepID=UPI001CD67DDB|nr:PH domain-containing protein [Nocardia sp. alder85J]MCX4096062.1 PH domain-containing protein [Nocardia sp. alder85J]
MTTPDATPWHHLDRRMLLLHPVREVVRYIPVLLATVIIGTRNDNPMWGLAALTVIVAMAVTRWFTTTYRLGPDTVELRRGLLQRKTLTVPRSRIRSVDVRADLLHRLLGLAVLTIGTGQRADREERFHLDGVDARAVPALRAALMSPARAPATVQPDDRVAARPHSGTPGGGPAPLDRAQSRPVVVGSTAAPAPPIDAPGPAAAVPARAEPVPGDHLDARVRVAPDGTPGRGALETFGESVDALRGRYLGESEPDGVEIGHWRAGWVRYAPLSLTGLAIFGPLVGLASQYGATDRLVRSDAVQGLGRHSGVYLAVVALTGIAILLVVSAAAACLRYLTTYFGLRVIDDGSRLHISHGLFTTRQITLDLSRLRGATVNEPLLLRLAGAAELEAVMTGTRTRQRILPQAPRGAVDHTLAHLLSETVRAARPASDTNSPAQHHDSAEAWALVTAAPVRHGPRAHRRRYIRALAPVLLATLIILGISLGGNHIPGWVWAILVLLGIVAAVVAEDRYRGLGHVVLPGSGARPTWLITRSGSLDRERHCLEAPGVIGWTVRRTFFQRRAGLATVVAATAAGKKRYHVQDVPIDLAWALVEAVTPGMSGAR